MGNACNQNTTENRTVNLTEQNEEIDNQDGQDDYQMDARRSRISSLRNSQPIQDAAIVMKRDFQIGDSIYSGQMLPVNVDGQEELVMHNHGKRTWPNGDQYEGEYVHGEAMGEGKFVYTNGDMYQGHFEGDRANGYGTFIQELDGLTRTGNWKNNRQNGQGEERLPDGSNYQGEYVNGQKSGKGTYCWSDNSKYVGTWKDDCIDGQGTYSWEDGRRYVGAWRKNLMHGYGEQDYEDGRTYRGDYKDDKKHGYGVYTWPDGKIYDGHWKEGKQHGEARFTNTQGKSKIGVWVEGERSKWLKADEVSKASQSKFSKQNYGVGPKD